MQRNIEYGLFERKIRQFEISVVIAILTSFLQVFDCESRLLRPDLDAVVETKKQSPIASKMDNSLSLITMVLQYILIFFFSS